MGLTSFLSHPKKANNNTVKSLVPTNEENAVYDKNSATKRRGSKLKWPKVLRKSNKSYHTSVMSATTGDSTSSDFDSLDNWKNPDDVGISSDFDSCNEAIDSMEKNERPELLTSNSERKQNHISFPKNESPTQVIVTDQIYSGNIGRSRRSKAKKSVLCKAPSARASAFSGPPRYDWVDVEAAAAIKLQAAYRRFQAINELDRQGLTTAGMRKQRRKRKAKQKRKNESLENRSLFSCCATFEFLFWNDFKFFEEEQKERNEKYLMKKLDQESKEKEMRKFHMMKKPSQCVLEEIEVVEEFDDTEVTLSSI